MRLALETYHGKKEEPKEEKPVVDRTKEVELLKKALTNALQLSISNVEQLQGVTQIFVDVSGSMKSPLSGGKSFGSVRQCFEMSIILGLMVMSRCKSCEYYIFSSIATDKCYILMNERLTGNLETDIETVKAAAETLGGGTDFPVEVVIEATANKKHVDNMIILSDMMISQNFNNGEGYIEAIDKYREKVNPKLRVFSIDLRGYSKAQDIKKEFAEHNFIRIFGANASILKFISATESSQIDHIRKFHTTLP
jgi:hypothetical protein